MNDNQEDIRYLDLLSEKYPTITAAVNRMITLRANMNLPKGTEHFISDIHGEHEAFLHMLRNASGVVKLKIDDLFSHNISAEERKSLATLIYYPEQKLETIKRSSTNLSDWYKITLYRLLQLAHLTTAKYSRAYVRRAIDSQFEYLLEELIYGTEETDGRLNYYEGIIDSIISVDQADAFITDICNLISRLAVDTLHILGDIYDRGPGADVILDALMKYHSIDIQWGNHDMTWMGAAAGSEICIANVIRMCARYDNIHTLEDGYGISMRPLITFAMDAYRDDPCESFRPKLSQRDALNAADYDTLAKIHKAIAIIQFKLESQIAKRHPEFNVDYKALFDKIDYDNCTITINSKSYKMKDCLFPTVDRKDPYKLTNGEIMVLERLKLAFRHSDRLQRHVRFLYSKGSMYTCANGNLLYHGCMPLDGKGRLASMNTPEGPLCGKKLLDFADATVRYGYFSKEDSKEKEYALDFTWYLWCGPLSPLYGKDKMTTFERYFIEENETWHEKKNPYYDLIDREGVCDAILAEFSLGGPDSHIISGHTPVEKGDSPIRAGGKLLIIDGGLSKAYQKKTGIAGYTLIYNSWGMLLTSHEPFVSKQVAIDEELDIHSTSVVLEKVAIRKRIKDTDKGKELQKQLEELEKLRSAYIKGLIKEKG